MKEFWEKFKGAIIGGVIAMLILASNLLEGVFYIAFIIFGICLGNYVQDNKEEVKERLKNFIDKF